MGRRKVNVAAKVYYLIEYILLRIVVFPLLIIPYDAAVKASVIVGILLYYLDFGNKKWAHMNLNIIFKDRFLKLHERKELLKKLYKNIARTAVEFVKIGHITKDNLGRYGYFDNIEALEKALAEQKGVIAVSLHLGNWELLGTAYQRMGFPVSAVINRQFNPFGDNWMYRIREKDQKVKPFYNEVSSMTNLIRYLKKNGIVSIVADQTYYFQPIFVPFFGQVSATADGPAKLHLKFGSPIVIAVGILEDDGRYRFLMEDPVHFEKTDDFDADCRRVMTYINQRYEYYIKKYPDQWFSMLHGRWERTKPEDFEDVDWDPF